jgi:hypothetical protein
LQRAREVRGLGSDVRAGDERTPFRGFLVAEALADKRSTGISRSAQSMRCLACGASEYLYVVFNRRHCCTHLVPLIFVP